MAVAQVDDQDVDDAIAEYGRVKSDPSIGVADLEFALNEYFKEVGYRNIEEVLDVIKDGRVTWKTSPKARVSDLGLICL